METRTNGIVTDHVLIGDAVAVAVLRAIEEHARPEGLALDVDRGDVSMSDLHTQEQTLKATTSCRILEANQMPAQNSNAVTVLAAAPWLWVARDDCCCVA